MSASLVGSGDVYKRQDPLRDPRRAAPTFSQRKRARERRPVRPRFRPVSYTHLTLPTICSV
eukprot:11736398-Alexandrium_andersonii.AAC.1